MLYVCLKTQFRVFLFFDTLQTEQILFIKMLISNIILLTRIVSVERL